MSSAKGWDSKRYPEEFWRIIEIEQRIGHTWKAKKALKELWNECLDIDDMYEDKLVVQR